jgi:hypothetical protein
MAVFRLYLHMVCPIFSQLLTTRKVLSGKYSNSSLPGSNPGGVNCCPRVCRCFIQVLQTNSVIVPSGSSQSSLPTSIPTHQSWSFFASYSTLCDLNILNRMGSKQRFDSKRLIFLWLSRKLNQWQGANISEICCMDSLTFIKSTMDHVQLIVMYRDKMCCHSFSLFADALVNPCAACGHYTTVCRWSSSSDADVPEVKDSGRWGDALYCVPSLGQLTCIGLVMNAWWLNVHVLC